MEKSRRGFDSAAAREFLLELQELIVEHLEQVDGKNFFRDNWERPEGRGLSCIIEEGNVLEPGGVAFSHMKGDKMPLSATAHRPELAGRLAKWRYDWPPEMGTPEKKLYAEFLVPKDWV